MNSVIKTIISHALAIVATAVATTAWAASHSIDLYAIWGQINHVVAEIATIVATITPIITMIWSTYRTQVKQRVTEIANDPKAVAAAAALPPTPQTAALGDALKK